MMMEQPADTIGKPSRRIAVIDSLRGLALLAMASYHFTWDLENFGYVSQGLTAFGPWKIYARCIASTFLFLVGVSLFLAHGRGIRWPGFRRRFAMVALSAAAITAVTWFVTPDAFIFFGILHEIALASLLGLAFLRLPALLTLLIAAVVVAAPNYVSLTSFDHPALWWIGLSAIDPRSNDFVPLFPWFGAVLAGIGVTKLAAAADLLGRLRALRPGGLLSILGLAGRHSLAFYLIHQPLLFGGVWLFSQIHPAPALSPQDSFLQSCAASCQQSRDAVFCPRYCGCMLDALSNRNMLARLFKDEQDAGFHQQVSDLASTCTVKTDEGLQQGDTQ